MASLPDEMMDEPLAAATGVVEQVLGGMAAGPVVTTLFDRATSTASHVVHDPATRVAAVIDSVLDFDQASGRIGFAAAQRIVEHVRAERLSVAWLLETHVHADHLSAAPWLQGQIGGQIGIGREIITVQNVFGKIFNEGTEFVRDGSQFDRLFDDGDRFRIGEIDVAVLHVPGHTSADLAYVAGDAVFAGDTLFMPDYGTARADFPGGDAAMLFRSIRRLLRLPAAARLFLCHDYMAPGRDYFAWETTIGAERSANVHVRDGITEAEFVAMRVARDATLGMPKLILPSIQVNMRAGRLPPQEANGTSYLKLPIGVL